MNQWIAMAKVAGVNATAVTAVCGVWTQQVDGFTTALAKGERRRHEVQDGFKMVQDGWHRSLLPIVALSACGGIVR
jgi:ferric-dicitrate binding protein FerR (iron transport regulator)